MKNTEYNRQIILFGKLQQLNGRVETNSKLLEFQKKHNFVSTNGVEQNYFTMQNKTYFRASTLFVGEKGAYSVRLESDRIHIEEVVLGRESPFDTFIDFSKNIINELVNLFGFTFNRMSFGGTKNFEECTNDEFDAFYTKFIKNENPNNSPTTWELKEYNRIYFNLVKEIVNSNVTIARSRVSRQTNIGLINLVEAIVYTFDINTIPETQNYRFGLKEIELFLEEALKERNKILSRVEVL